MRFGCDILVEWDFFVGILIVWVEMRCVLGVENVENVLR